MIEIERTEAHNGDGWHLSLRRTVDEARLDPEQSPLLIIPGYGMNSFIFGFHPRGVSMEAALAARGFEVWSVDLRGQGESRRNGGSSRFGLEQLVLTDVPCAVRTVLEQTRTRADTVSLVGCSLGATMMFAYAVCVPEHRINRLVNVGGPVRWVRIHPALKLAFSSPTLAGALPVVGVRQLAGVALPALRRAPKLLSIYLHADIVDMTHARQLVRTVENPRRQLNREIAVWIKNRDLVIDGKNVSEGVKMLQAPLLTMLANADGIVPRETTLWPHENIGSARREVIEVGTAEMPIAHADLFVSDHAPRLVFEPLAHWLAAR